MAEVAGNQNIAEGDLIELETLHTLLFHGVFSEYDELFVDGSLLDYQIEVDAPILACELSGDAVEYEISDDWPEDFTEANCTKERSRFQDSFLRAGLTSHSNLEDVMGKLRRHDDVIIGIDTNVLWDCILSSILLEEIYKEDFPNWILVAVPRLVMAETENAANDTFGGSHPRSGGPDYKGRVGQRALQEIMDLREPDSTRPGLSMLTVGEIDQGADVGRDNWRVDSLIRHQFQTFLDDISFHKGTYFLSQDRVNVMMSGTEGASGLYLQKPDFDAFRSGTIPLRKLGRLIYELSIQFGKIQIRAGPEDDAAIELSIFWAGKQVSDWRDGKMEVRSLNCNN